MKKCQSLFIKLICMTAMGLSLTACYRMPSENDFSLVPTTNNPSVTCQKSQSLLPSASY